MGTLYTVSEQETGMHTLVGQPLLQRQGQEKRALQNIFLTYRYWRQKNLTSQVTAKFYDARPNGSHSSDYIYIYISRISSRIRAQPIYSLLHEGAVGNSRTSEKKFIYVPVVPDMWLRKAFQIWVLKNHTTIHKIKQFIHITSKNLPTVQRATATSSLQSLLPSYQFARNQGHILLC